jgi:dienelactone hydrolase
MTPILRLKGPVVAALLLHLAVAGAAPRADDFTGHVPFNVGSDSGRVENIAVTVGDGGTGPYKAILSGDSTLPTHTIYRPRDLKPFGPTRRLPVVAFANGGCRASSGEFRNLLSEVASHGYLVVAIGAAGTAAVAGSEEHVGTSKASQLLDAVDWATRQSAQPHSIFFQKIDTSKVAVVGQSCGGMQALAVSADPRISTSIILNSSSAIAGGPGAAPKSAVAPASRGQYGSAGADVQSLMGSLNKASQRYTPYGPPNTLTMNQDVPSAAGPLPTLHAPIAYIAGGPSDLAYAGAQRDFNAITNLPVVFINQNVGHYPGTYRQPNGGAFAIAVTAWLQWQLRGDPAAKKMFVGADCGLCRDATWTVATKNLH